MEINFILFKIVKNSQSTLFKTLVFRNDFKVSFKRFKH